MINDYEATEPMTTDAHISHPSSINNDDVISTLNGLIETCKDGQEGFKEAAEGVERSDLKSLFYEFSQQRSKFAGDLQSLVQTLGGDPETTGSFTGTIHRGWMNIKSAVTGKDEAAILSECERGEDSAKKTYKTALEGDLPIYINDVITDQFVAVQKTHDKVKALRDAAKGSTSRSAASGF